MALEHESHSVQLDPLWIKVSTDMWVIQCPNFTDCGWEVRANCEHPDEKILNDVYGSMTYREIAAEEIAEHLADHLERGEEIDVMTGEIVT